MKEVLKCLFILFSISAYGQGNLVPNPSFEQYDTCPDNIGQINRALGWSSLGNSPDYFNVCGTPNLFSIPYNGFGYQQAATGNAYSGLVIYHESGYREYIGSVLSQPLILNQEYYVSFKINRPNYSDGTYDYILSNKIGVQFSTVQPSDSIVPSNFSHVHTNLIVTDTLNWILIKGSFTADSAYSFITVGNFFDNVQTDTINIPGANLIAYYYIDDVCVSTDSISCYVNTENVDEIGNGIFINLFPSTASNLINIHTNINSNYELLVYSNIGQVIFYAEYNLKQVIIDFSNYASGIYFFVFKYKGIYLTKKVLNNNNKIKQ